MDGKIRIIITRDCIVDGKIRIIITRNCIVDGKIRIIITRDCIVDGKPTVSLVQRSPSNVEYVISRAYTRTKSGAGSSV